MTLRERAASLLGVVDEYRDRECRTVLERAQYEAAAVARRAHAEARHRVHQIVVAERQRAMAAIRAAQAELQTARRHYRRRRDLALLDRAWPRLEAALQRRWEEPEARRRWIDDLVAAAIQRLPAGPWTLTHPPSWPASERDAVVARVTDACGEPPRLVPDQEIGAGLLITSGTTTLDGSINGFLADRSAVAARLLALLEEEAPPPSPTPGDRGQAPSPSSGRGPSEGARNPRHGADPTHPLPLSPSHEGEGGLPPTDRRQAPSPPVGEGRGEGAGESAVDGDEP
jgi:type II secretory pathway pseudopilin PulG